MEFSSTAYSSTLHSTIDQVHSPSIGKPIFEQLMELVYRSRKLLSLHSKHLLTIGVSIRS